MAISIGGKKMGRDEKLNFVVKAGKVYGSYKMGDVKC